MLNEWERRFLELTQNHLDLVTAMRASGSDLAPEFFGYVAKIGSEAAPLVNGVTQSATIAIQADSWFLLEYITTAVVLPVTGVSSPSQMGVSGNVLLQVTDIGTGDELYSQPSGFTGFPGAIVSGTPTTASAGLPYVFPTPRLIPPRTNVKVEMTQFGFDAATNPQPLGGWIMLNGARIPLGGLN